MPKTAPAKRLFRKSPRIAGLALSAALMAAAAPLPALAQNAAPTTAQPYLEASAKGDIFEITTSMIALQKSQTPAVREFANMMIADHTRTTNRALATAQRASVTPPPAVLDAQQRQQVTQLLNASGPEFDRLYWQIQTAAHQQALALQRNYAQAGDQPMLQGFAARAAPVIAEHLEDAQTQARM